MLKKILIGIFIFIFLIIGTMALAPFIFKDKIIAALKSEINNQVEAKIDFGNFSISLFKDFPNLYFSINQVSIINNDPFKGDTLAFIGAFNISLDIMSVIKGESYNVHSIIIENTVLNAKINEAGKTNWDIIKPSETQAVAESNSASVFSLNLQTFKIINANIKFDDDSSKLYASIQNLNVNANGDFTQDNFLLNSYTTIEKLNYKDGSTSYLNNALLELKADLEVNQKTNTYVFKENELHLNGLVLGLDGQVVMNQDEYDLDLKFNTKETSFKTLLSLIPNIYKNNFESIKASGNLVLNGFAKGKYNETNYPAFGLQLNVDNASFQYPDLPTAVKNIFIDLNIENKGGDMDNTLLNLSQFSFKVDNEPFQLTAKIKTPISNPHIEAVMKGGLDLKKIPNYYPMEGLENMEGIFKADIKAKGYLSAIEEERYSDFDASGNFNLKKFKYASSDIPVPVSINNMDLNFNPKNVTVSDFNAQMGKSDFKAQGYLDNLLNYIFTDEKLKGKLTLRSQLLDLNELMTTETTEEEPTDTLLAIKVPNNIDFVFDAAFATILYDSIILKNAASVLTVKDETVRISNLHADIFGGSMKANGSYATKNPGNPEISFNYDLQNIDFQQAYKGLNSFSEYAPLVAHINGKFSSQLNIEGKLGEDLSPDLTSLIGDGVLEVNQITISGVDALNKIADKFKINQLKKLSVDKAYTSFKFKDGRMQVAPTDLKVNEMMLNFSGSHGLDNSLDYEVLIDAPTRLLQGSMGEVNKMIASAKIPGLSNTQIPEALKLKVGISGFSDNPQMKYSVVGKGGSSAKDNAKVAFDQKKQEMEDKAKAEIEAQKQKAQAEMNKQKQEAEAKAKAELDKAKQEAESKAKAETDKVKDKLKNKLKFP